jgi:UDP-glucose:(heptosyl)LPS alpha-1,3-glucosyltransferase
VKIAILRRRYAGHGGGERFTDEFLRRLARGTYQPHLVCHEWRAGVPGVVVHRVRAVPGGSALRTLGYALLAPRRARALDVGLIYSFERTAEQDVYRAGEGCHRQWLALRRRHLPRRSVAGRLRIVHAVLLWLERRICQAGAARVLVVNSRMVEQDLWRHYAPLSAEVALIRNGTDLRRFHPDIRAATRSASRRQLGLAPEDLVLLTVGSGFDRKGAFLVVRALGHLRRRTGLAPVVLLAGQGSDARLRRAAAREAVDGQLRALGVVDDVRPLYAAADVFVLPSVYDPASNATLEALAMGVPVVTTTTNGSAEVVEPGRSAWLLDDPSDVGGLAELLEQAADPGARRAVGEAGRRAVEPWTWERHVDEVVTLCARFARG